jgi:hypothetical protein
LATSPLSKKHGFGEHKQKAEHDRDLAERLYQESVFPDWVVTCSFYCALHSVDAYAHKLGIETFEPKPDEKTNAHRKRLRFVQSSLQVYFGRYNILLNRSEQCRYDPDYFRLMPKSLPETMLKLAEQFLLIK